MRDIDTVIQTIQRSHITLFILCGFPYAGKSYIAGELLTRTEVAYVSIDAIFHAYGFDWNTNKLPKTDEWQKIFDESYDQTKKALGEGRNVLYDSTNQTVASRDTLRKVAASVEGDTRVVYIKSSVATVWKRWEENQQNPKRSQVSRELVQMTIDMFEEPTEEECVLVIEN